MNIPKTEATITPGEIPLEEVEISQADVLKELLGLTDEEIQEHSRTEVGRMYLDLMATFATNFTAMSEMLNKQNQVLDVHAKLIQNLLTKVKGLENPAKKLILPCGM